MYFSVIVPVYNVELYLRQCLESLLAQTYSDYEVICVNDGSTDGSRDILSEYDEKYPGIKVIDRENGGLSTARNTGLEAATGDYVLLVDSDDWVEPTMLSRLAEEADGTDMICFGCRKSDCAATDTLLPEQTDGWSYYNRHALKSLIIPFVCVWQRCYRRKFLIENNMFFHKGIIHEDNEFTPRVCLKAKSVKVISDILYNYQVRPGSIMTTRGIKSKENLILIGNELSNMFSKETDIDKTTIYRALTHYYQMAFIDNTKDEDRRLKPLIEWAAYHRVSRTKLRHRIQYIAIKIHPALFRRINYNTIKINHIQ